MRMLRIAQCAEAEADRAQLPVVRAREAFNSARRQEWRGRAVLGRGRDSCNEAMLTAGSGFENPSIQNIRISD